VSIAAILLVLAAAALHAGWNLVVKAAGDRLVAAAAQMTLGALVSLPFLLFLEIPFRAWPYLVATGVVHLGYVLTLVGAYDRGDLSVVYPIARGSAPAMVTIGAAILLDDSPGGWGLIAIALVVLGILTVGWRGPVHGVGWALATSVFIAAYTMIDGAAVRSLDDSLAYTLTAFVAIAVVLGPFVMWRRGTAAIAEALSREWRSHLLAGAASVAAYGLVLAAARVSPLGLVSALRETSVLFGALGGWLILKERMGLSRLRGAVLIATGVVVLVLAT
jgi:drug/metabolite transporter (DMT)-like permease